MPAPDQLLANWLLQIGVEESTANMGAQLLLLAGVLALAAIANVVSKRIIATVIRKVATHTETMWDDVVVNHGVLDQLSQLAPAMVLYLSSTLLVPQWPGVQTSIRRLCIAYMVLMVTIVTNAMLNALVEIYGTLEVARVRPIKSYVQVVKLFVFSVAAVIAVSTLTETSPWAFLSGLAGLTAVLLLVFKDSILGLVASIQLTANNMLHVGDWIEMQEYGADGNVIDISLNTVKVRNWDKTISTIPTYALVTHSFRNWRGMEESGGRRIKRAIYVDMTTIGFLDSAQMQKLQTITLLTPYLSQKMQDIEADHQARQVNVDNAANRRRLTNIGTFRAYVEAYLRAHPDIRQDMTLIVRQLPPGAQGVGIELYCFTRQQQWARYEAVQSDIFDHMLSVMPEFGLRTFQSPSGSDIRQLKPEAWVTSTETSATKTSHFS